MSDQTPLATVDDLAARYPKASTMDAGLVEATLDDAADLVRGRMRGDVPRSTLRRVVCEAAARALDVKAASGMALGATQTTETVGPVSQSLTFGSPSGDLWLTRAELLAIGDGQAFVSVPMDTEAADDR